jgi:two-component sensor histidine kinase
VIGDTVDALTGGQDRLHVDTHIDDCTIPIEKAAPLALIVNEALTNAIKYGASAKGPSRIGVRAKLENGTLLVEVRDNGPGLPSMPPRSGSTGLRIIDGLAGQINATYELFTDGGAVFRLRMDLEPA